MTSMNTVQKMALGLLALNAVTFVARAATPDHPALSGSLSTVADGSNEVPAKPPKPAVDNQSYVNIAQNCDKATDLNSNAAIGAAALKPQTLSIAQYCEYLWKPIADSKSPACKDLIRRYQDGIKKFQGEICGQGGVLEGVEISVGPDGMKRIDFLLKDKIEFTAKLPGKGTRDYRYEPENGKLSFLVGADPAAAKAAVDALVDLKDKKARFIFSRSNYNDLSPDVKGFVDGIHTDPSGTMAVTIRRPPGRGIGKFGVKEGTPIYVEFGSTTYFQSKANPARNVSVGTAGRGEEGGAKAFFLPSFK